MASLTNEQIKDIQKCIVKNMAQKEKEFNDIKRAIKVLDQLNVLYYTGNITKSELIEGIIQAKDFMLDSLT